MASAFRKSIIGQVVREGTGWKGESVGTSLTKAGGLERRPMQRAGRQGELKCKVNRTSSW